VTTILIARHGESDWNRERRWQGQADRPLTERGREQAEALAQRLIHVELDAIYSSDLQRAYDTATEVARGQRLEVIKQRDLREVDVGSWSGLTRTEAEEGFPEGFARWREGHPGWTDGESYEAMAERVVEAVTAFGRLHEIAHELKNKLWRSARILVVSHGGPIRAIHAAALGLDVHAYRRLRPVEPNARLSAVRYVDWALTDLIPANQIDALLERDERERRDAAAQPPTPAG
jgi:broad specificity phosphatase PhoE